VPGMALLPPLCRLILRADFSALERAGISLGIPLPAKANRVARDDWATVLWLGPDERLLLADSASEEALLETLEESLAPHPHALVCVSHRQGALSLQSSAAATLLAAGCPRDLNIEAFGIDACARTVFGKAEVILWRTASDSFHIEVARSFMEYVTGVLAEAAVCL
jgi:sarcosine oxidase, subunit gamma